jgi:galactose mutarotase-like enzyme
MYFAVGGHPGFRCPVKAGEKFTGHYLEMERDVYHATLLDKGLRTSKKTEITTDDGKLWLLPSLFDNDALVFEGGQVNRISLVSHLSGKKVEMECDRWPYFGIWTKKGCDQFVCLEPWYGITDHESATGALQEKQGMIRLEAGRDFAASYIMRFF